MTAEEIRNLDAEAVQRRFSELEEERNAKGGIEQMTDEEVTAMTEEINALTERRKELAEAEAKRSELAAAVAAGEVGKAERKVVNNMPNEREELAKRLADTHKIEMRALLATGKIAKPNRVGGISELPETASDIVDDVNAISLTGNGSWVVAYKKTDAAAADVTDGSAVAGTGSDYDYVTINPAEWGVLDEISQQVRKMTSLDYLSAIQNSALVALRAKASEKIVAAIKSSDLAEKKTVALDQDYLRTIVLGFRANRLKGDVKLYISQADLLTLGKIRGTNEKRALYTITFDAGSTTSGTITEGGLAVQFRVLDQLTAGTQLFGQPGAVDMPMWDNYEIETDTGGDFFKRNMIGVRGLQTANADLVSYHGMQVVTQAAA